MQVLQLNTWPSQWQRLSQEWETALKNMRVLPVMLKNQNYLQKPTDFQKHTDPTKNLSRIRKLNSYTLHLLTHTTMNTLSFAWNTENTSCVKNHSQSMHPRPVKYLALQKKKKLLLTEAIWPRYQPFIKELQKTIASGIIGEVTTVTANLFYSIDMNQRIHDINLAGGALLDVGIYAINFALMCLGNDVEKVTAVCQKFESGVDKQSAVILNYADGKMAVTCSGTQAISDRKGIISGRKDHIIVENINSPESFSVYDSQRKLISEHKAPQSITGYEYEVLASMEAIKKGTLEYADCSHAQSIKLLEIMDEARAQMGIKYPFE